jgi:hypothetical protein
VKKKRKKALETPAESGPGRLSRWAAPAVIAALVLVFYLVPLTSDSASIQWDAADLHYPFQKYWSDHLRSGSLPLWTPYLFAGYPFMAYPETAVWYPPHWPFFLAGITPRLIEAELALNAFLACLGAFLLIARFVENRWAAVLGGLCYGLSGFFAGHASHIGIFVAAACFPWLLLAFRYALDRAVLLYTVLGGMVGASMILAGYFQTAMYGFLALGLYAMAELYLTPRRFVRIAGIVAGMLGLAIILSSIQILPTLELLHSSFRGHSDYSRTAEGVLELRALPTLLVPDWLGVISDQYTGPADRTQYYFYAGLLLLPLAILGLARTKTRLHALFLIVPTAWFMFGPAAGLFRIAMLLPLMNKVREPIQGWFIIALGLAMLAAAGFGWAQRRWRFPYLSAAVIAILFVDVWYWNSLRNPLAYGRFSFDHSYGAGEDALLNHVVPAVPPLTRFAGGRKAVVGLQNSALDLHLESVAGYAALPIRDYTRYVAAMERNHRLLDGLGISTYWRASAKGVGSNPYVLPRAYFPQSIVDIGTRAEALSALETLDPHSQSVVFGPHGPVRQDPEATARVLAYDEDSYRILYHAPAPALLRLSVPYYTGWRASVEDQKLPIVHVDLALMGVVVPAGDHELDFSFHSESFAIGAAITLGGLMLCALLLVAPRARLWLKRGRLSEGAVPALPPAVP